MSEIKVDTLTGKTTATTVTGPDLFKTDELQGKTSAGDITVTSEGGAATMQLQQGLAKFWIRHSSASAIQDSFNASSVTDNATGDFTVVIANNMSNPYYSFITTSGSDGGNNFAGSRLRSGSSGDCRCIYGYNDLTLYDWAQICVSIDGDLA
jgi:hypothetical protein